MTKDSRQQMNLVYSPALGVASVPLLGYTFVAKAPIEAGTLLLREKPLVMASAIEDVEPALASSFRKGAETGEVDLEEVLVMVT